MDAISAFFLTASLAFTGWITWFVVTQGAVGAVEPNSVVGIKTRATQASPAAWEAGHRAALPWTKRTVIASVAVSMTGALVLATSSGTRATAVGTVLTLSGFVVLVVGVLIVARVANKAAREVT